MTLSLKEAADRLAIRELVERYAHCADRRDAKGQMALFTADTHFVVYMNAKDPTPITGAALARGASCGFRGPEPVRRDHAFSWADHNPHPDPRPRHRGNLLHAASPHDQRRKTSLMIAALRYTESLLRLTALGYSAERRLYVDWIEQRAL